MKILIVFYSRSGMTRKTAEAIAASLRERAVVDFEEIIDKDKRVGAWGYLKSGREAMQKKRADIEALNHKVGEYDWVIVGTPTWAYNMACAVRSYLEDNRGHFSRLAFFATHGSNGGQRAIEEMRKLAGVDFGPSLVVTSREAISGDYQPRLNDFLKDIE